jgi:hypothetical protein
MSAEELRARIIATDKAGGDPYTDVLELMQIDESFDIGICILLETTMEIIQHRQRRTQTIEAIRYEAMAA